ncbi:hypothetical protein [Streptomyces sp. SS8]
MREDQRGQDQDRRDQDRRGQGRRDRRGPGERRAGARTAGGSAAQVARTAQTAQDDDAERRRRRAVFLRELNEAKALRERVQPRRARAARMRQAMRMRTFRW